MFEDAKVDCADCVGEKSLEAQVKGEPLKPEELKARESQEFLDDITKHFMMAQTTKWKRRQSLQNELRWIRRGSNTQRCWGTTWIVITKCSFV